MFEIIVSEEFQNNFEKLSKPVKKNFSRKLKFLLKILLIH